MFPVPDGFAFFYLVLFLIGLLFVIVSALMGFGSDLAHTTGFHLPGFDSGNSADLGHDLGHGVGHTGHPGDFSGHVGHTSDIGHAGHANGGSANAGSAGAHAGPAAHATHPIDGSSHESAKVTSSASPFNLMTLMTFLTWFGGAGYILYVLASWPLILSLIGAVVAGIIGGWLVYLLLVKFFLAGAVSTDPSAREVVGSIARVTIPITKDAPGEVVYTLDGARHSDGARSLDALPIPGGTEVVIVRLERGIAYVQPWSRFVDESVTTQRKASLDSPPDKSSEQLLSDDAPLGEEMTRNEKS